MVLSTAKVGFLGLLILLLGSGCASGVNPVENLPAETLALPLVASPGEAVPSAPVDKPEPAETAQDTATPVLPAATAGGENLPPTSGPDCLGEGINPIASAIAADYETTSYAEVMTWFCNGAEFEDILTALLTEELTGVPAEELLVMLADGFSWDEIWQVIGLTE